MDYKMVTVSGIWKGKMERAFTGSRDAAALQVIASVLATRNKELKRNRRRMAKLIKLLKQIFKY